MFFTDFSLCFRLLLKRLRRKLMRLVWATNRLRFTRPSCSSRLRTLLTSTPCTSTRSHGSSCCLCSPSTTQSAPMTSRNVWRTSRTTSHTRCTVTCVDHCLRRTRWVLPRAALIGFLVIAHFCISSAWRQEGLTGYCFKYIDRPFCFRANDMLGDTYLITWMTNPLMRMKEPRWKKNHLFLLFFYSHPLSQSCF